MNLTAEYRVRSPDASISSGRGQVNTLMYTQGPVPCQISGCRTRSRLFPRTYFLVTNENSPQRGSRPRPSGGLRVVPSRNQCTTRQLHDGPGEVGNVRWPPHRGSGCGLRPRESPSSTRGLVGLSNCDHDNFTRNEHPPASRLVVNAVAKTVTLGGHIQEGGYDARTQGAGAAHITRSAIPGR